MLMPWRCSTCTAMTRPGRGRHRPASRSGEWSFATPSESYQTVNSSTAVPRKGAQSRSATSLPLPPPPTAARSGRPEAESAASEHPAHEVETARHSGADSATDEQRPATRAAAANAPTIISSQAIRVSAAAATWSERRWRPATPQRWKALSTGAWRRAAHGTK